MTETTLYIPMSPTLLMAVGEVPTPATVVLRDTAAGGGGGRKRPEN